MILIKKGTTNNVSLGVSINKTLPNPYYLFNIVHIQSKDTRNFIPEVITTNDRYDEFRFSAGTPQNLSLTPPVVYFPYDGQCWVKVYEQTSSGNTDPSLAQNLLWEGRALIEDENLPETFYQWTSSNEDNANYIFLSDDEISTPTPTPSPSQSITPTPTPSITSSVTPTPTPSLPPSPTPSPYKMVIGSGFDWEASNITPGTGDTLYIAGYFSSYNTQEKQLVAKIHQDGTLDTGWGADFTQFQPGQYVNSIQPTEDGVYAFGNFQSYGNNPAIGTIKYLVRLDTDTGVRDTSFVAVTNNRPKNVVKKNGKTYFTGYFTTWNGTSVGRIVETDSNGTITNTFGTGFNNNVFGMVEHPDGDYVLYGQFTQFSGITAPKIIKMDIETGVVDTAFMTNIGTGIAIGNIWDIKVGTSSNGLYISHDSSVWNGVNISGKRIIRLGSNGTRDVLFEIGLGGVAFSIWVDEPNDYIYYMGSVNEVLGNSRYWGRWRISTMSLDTTFNGNAYGSAYNTINLTGNEGSNSSPGQIYIDAQGRIYLVGAYTLYFDNSLGEFEDYSRIIRVYVDNTINTISN